MQYSEKEILKKREEAKKKANSTIEGGYYINNETLHFVRESLLEKFSVCLPDTHMLLPLELAQIKYPSEFRPQVIMSSLDSSVNFGFSIFNHKLHNRQTKELAMGIQQMIEREKQSIFYQFKELESVAGYYFTFRSHAMDTDLFNMQLICPIKDSMLQASFNCPYVQCKEWEKAALLVWNTIENLG